MAVLVLAGKGWLGPGLCDLSRRMWSRWCHGGSGRGLCMLCKQRGGRSAGLGSVRPRPPLRNGDLPAMSACVGIGCREDPLRYPGQEAAFSLREKAVDLVAIGTSGTVGHIHHIPMVVTGWRVGVIALGRCANIGPALCCGVKFARDGSKLRFDAWCQLASGCR